MTNPPDGYLGVEGRITSGPAEELVATGYAWELADAEILHDGLDLADMAHVLELLETDVMPRAAAEALLAVLVDVHDRGPEAVDYDPVLGDAYNSRERFLEQALGATAGWLPTGRTRREAGRIAFRLRMMDELCGAIRAASAFGQALTCLAEEHAATTFNDTTYLQPAQPSSVGHFLLAHAASAVRDAERFTSALAWFDRSPAGVGGVAGTRIPLDRQRLAARLGFSRVGVHTRDVMWSVDGCTDAVVAASQAATTASRLAEDLEIWSSPQFGLVDLDPSLCRASVLLPQKKNPYALAVLRAAASRLVGRATGLLTTQRTPSARTDNWLLTYGETFQAVSDARAALELAAKVVSTMTIDVDRAGADVGLHHTMATDLTEALVLVAGVDYRSAYRLVAAAAAAGIGDGDGTFRREVIADIAQRAGRPEVADQLWDAIRIEDVLVHRTGEGSAAPDEVRTMAVSIRAQLRQYGAVAQDRVDALGAARDLLVAEARTVATSSLSA